MKTLVETRADRLRQLREDLGLTYQFVASKIDKSYETVRRYENNPHTKIGPETLQLLAKVYKTTPEYIKEGQQAKTAAPHPDSTVAFADSSNPDYIYLPFVTPPVYGSFLNSCHDRNYGDFDTARIEKEPGVDYKDAVVLEVRGNSMAPRYPERSRHVVRPVSDGNWQHATGVHAIALRSEMFVIKRIVNNVAGVLRLKSDSNGDEMEITLGDINCMWKVGEATFMPAED